MKSSRIATQTKEFKPSANQEKFLDAAIQSGEDTIVNIAKLAGIDECTYYRWRKEPGFLEWYDTEYQKGLLANRWRLSAIGMKQARRDHKYWRDMLEVTGILDNQTPTTAIQNNTFSFSDEQIKRLLE